MKSESDIVELLIRRAGRRVEPPPAAYEQVYRAAHASFRDKLRARRRPWILGAAAAATFVLAVALMLRFAPPAARLVELAEVARLDGEVDVQAGGAWRPLATARARLGPGSRVRTQADGRVAFALSGGESLRIAPGTEVMFDAPQRLYVQQGTVYVDSGERLPADGLEIVTPAGTARDLGTQFELQVADDALRLRVREGLVSVDRGGRSYSGHAGEQLVIDGFGGVVRSAIAPSDPAWQWAESIAPMPDMDGMPASALIAFVARETGRRLHYESALVEQRASAVILHGDIRHLAPIEALEAMLATTDLVVELDGDTMEVKARGDP